MIEKDNLIFLRTLRILDINWKDAIPKEAGKNVRQSEVKKA